MCVRILADFPFPFVLLENSFIALFQLKFRARVINIFLANSFFVSFYFSIVISDSFASKNLQLSQILVETTAKNSVSESAIKWWTKNFIHCRILIFFPQTLFLYLFYIFFYLQVFTIFTNFDFNSSDFLFYSINFSSNFLTFFNLNRHSRLTGYT